MCSLYCQSHADNHVPSGCIGMHTAFGLDAARGQPHIGTQSNVTLSC